MSPQDKKSAKLGCAAIAVFVLLVGGCVNLMDGDDAPESSAGTSVSDASDSGSDTVTVPDYTGRNLQEAQDAAQDKGIYLLKSRDLSSRHRMQVWDRHWQVCDQEPAAGSVMEDADTLTFDVVKTGESCDAPDAAGSVGDDGTPEPTDEPTGSGSSATSGGSDVDEGDSSGGSGLDEGGSSGDSGDSGGSGADGGDSSGGSGAGGSGSSGGSSSSGGTGSEGSGGSASGGEEQPQAPAGASARCNDGTYSYSGHRRGTCSHHHGVAVWLKSLPA
ncbi:DUF3761 domain-containing protein [Streptomyces decoyicus]|uniref:DUF3761 domain-containing protein n=1 Tax=Streptomyces decoyicus TaxID=249567 RepID=UPI0036585658